VTKEREVTGDDRSCHFSSGAHKCCAKKYFSWPVVTGFWVRYPTDERLDYAQYQLAMTHFKEMKKPDRDPTATMAALAEFDTFFQRFPSSSLTPEVRLKWRVARDRLSEGIFSVGVFYYKKHWYPGAADRLNEVSRDDPGYTHIDAVYYYLAETFASADRKSEAIPLFDRVVKNYQTSEYLPKAQKRLRELNAR